MKKLLSLCMFFVVTAHAQIGNIIELTGTAAIKRGKESIPAQKGTVIEQNDKVETKNGKLKIIFKDNTVVTVTEHSNLLIDDFVYDPKSGRGNLALKAAAGTVRYVSGAIAKDPKQVKINTPTAAIAVRGTDFIMSVNEVGASMVILMPSCDWETSAVKGASCATGSIDVESGPNLVSMNRPYQATLVETAGQPPTPPITVNLFSTPISNNLQIAPPRTINGTNVVSAARSAAASVGVSKESKKDDKDAAKDDASDSEKQQVAAATKEDVSQKVTSTEVKTSTADTADTVIGQTAAVAATDDTNLFALYKDRAQTQQIGWMYESLSPSGNNYANITQGMGSKINVYITQDMLTIGHNFSSGRAIGQIVVNQTYR